MLIGTPDNTISRPARLAARCIKEAIQLRKNEASAATSAFHKSLILLKKVLPEVYFKTTEWVAERPKTG